MNVVAFDIETVPDVAGGRRVYGLDDLDDEAVAKAMAQLRWQKTGSEFLPHHLHRVVAIAIVLHRGDTVRLWSLGDPAAAEAELVGRFFDGLERFTPTLISWNGSGFDLPVLHYRALLNGVAAPRYWEVGEEDRSFRYNNYLGRFHWRHIDLMDVLAGYQHRAAAPLEEIACMLGLPGKLGRSGAGVWDAYREGDLAGIRDYCEIDVLNTYLIYLRFERMRGGLTSEGYQTACTRVQETLEALDRPHLNEFLSAWTRG